MSHVDTTSWRLIQEASSGDARAREEFAALYGTPARAYLTARWRRSGLASEVDDAVQEVFLECFRRGGALEKADATRPGGFRAFFYSLLRNVALRFEQRVARKQARPERSSVHWNTVAGSAESLSAVFDRAWARAIMKEAAVLMGERAKDHGDAAVRRVELLRLRFQEGLPIRDIAQLWQQDAAFLHHEYATARKEFEEALREVVARHAAPADAARALRELLDALT